MGNMNWREILLTVTNAMVYGFPIVAAADKVKRGKHLTVGETKMLSGYYETLNEQATGDIDKKLQEHVDSIGLLLAQRAKYLPPAKPQIKIPSKRGR